MPEIAGIIQVTRMHCLPKLALLHKSCEGFTLWIQRDSWKA